MLVTAKKVRTTLYPRFPMNSLISAGNSVGRIAKNHIHLLSVDTGVCQIDLPRAMTDRDGRAREIQGNRCFQASVMTMIEHEGNDWCYNGRAWLETRNHKTQTFSHTDKRTKTKTTKKYIVKPVISFQWPAGIGFFSFVLGKEIDW